MISSKATIHVSMWLLTIVVLLGNFSTTIVLTTIDQASSQRETKRERQKPLIFFSGTPSAINKENTRNLGTESNFDAFPVCLLSSLREMWCSTLTKCICFQTCKCFSQMIVWDPNMVGKKTRQHGSISFCLRLNSCTSSAMLFRHHSGINYLSTGS